MDGFGRQKQVFCSFWFLARYATIVASPLNLPQTKQKVIPLEPKISPFNKMFSFNAIYILHKSRVTVTESYISMSVIVRSKNVLVKASDIFLLLFPFSWNYAGTLLSSVYKTYGGPLSIECFHVTSSNS